MVTDGSRSSRQLLPVGFARQLPRGRWHRAPVRPGTSNGGLRWRRGRSTSVLCRRLRSDGPSIWLLRAQSFQRLPGAAQKRLEQRRSRGRLGRRPKQVMVQGGLPVVEHRPDPGPTGQCHHDVAGADCGTAGTRSGSRPPRAVRRGRLPPISPTGAIRTCLPRHITVPPAQIARRSPPPPQRLVAQGSSRHYPPRNVLV